MLSKISQTGGWILYVITYPANKNKKNENNKTETDSQV